MRTLHYAPDAWKYLNGIFCIYKPSEIVSMFARNTLSFNLCRDLNQMEKRPAQNLVKLEGSVVSGKPFSVEVAPNYADHELVSGPRYQVQDIRMTWAKALGRHTSGVMLMGVNNGCYHVKKLNQCNLLCRYEVKGRLGAASDTFMVDGKIRERSTYSHVRQAALDRLLASIQASHQALAFQYSGVDMHSQEAYELASKGIIRPSGKSNPIIYGMKCTKFEPPDFTLDIQCINETEVFLAEMVHQIGVYLKTSALCTQLRCIQVGYFTLDHALLRKHWTLEHILSNITLCKKLSDTHSTSAHFEAVKVSKLKEVISDMQEEAREDVL